MIEEFLVPYDIVLSGGRVLDPESGLDGRFDVGVEGRRVAAVGEALEGSTTIDVSGLVVAPGFIDLHSHAQTLPGRRLQACDGVTTALELEAGRAPVDLAYAREARTGFADSFRLLGIVGPRLACMWSQAACSTAARSAIFGGIVGEAWQQAAAARS